MNRIIETIALTVLLTAPAMAQKIITAGSSSTEIVCRLGLCENIIATDRTSVYPDKMQSIPSIGYKTGITSEGIISLGPEMVILEEGYVKDAVLEQLKETDIKVLVVKNEPKVESTYKRIESIAKFLKKEKAGKELISEIKQKLEAVAKKVSASDLKPKVVCVYARGPGNLMIGGKGTGFMSIKLAGAVNAIPEISGYKPLNAESLIAANPDYLLFFEEGLTSLGGVEAVLEITGVKETTAGKKKQIIALDGVMLTNFGPRLPDAVAELHKLMHP